MNDKKIPVDAILYMFHHIFLPPKLPRKDDSSTANEEILLDTVFDSLEKFKCSFGANASDQSATVDSAIAMIANLRDVHDWGSILENGAVNENKLATALRSLSKKGEHSFHN